LAGHGLHSGALGDSSNNIYNQTFYKMKVEINIDLFKLIGFGIMILLLIVVCLIGTKKEKK